MQKLLQYLFPRLYEKYMFWRYPELTPEQESEYWRGIDHTSYN